MNVPHPKKRTHILSEYKGLVLLFQIFVLIINYLFCRLVKQIHTCVFAVFVWRQNIQVENSS